MIHKRASHNGRLVQTATARFPLLTSASLFGRGVFTTIAIYHGSSFQWDQHWSRLMEHASRVHVNTDELDKEQTLAWLHALIEGNQVEEGRARLTLIAASEHEQWGVEHQDKRKTELIIITGDRRDSTETGVTLTISPYRVNTHSPLTGIKSINYLHNILAREEARSRDFNEAVVLNESGEIASAVMANIFWTKEGILHTPTLLTGALAGTTRRVVMELADELSVPIVEGVYDLSDLADADEIFLTSAGLGVAFVSTYDYRQYTVPAGSIVARIHEAFRQKTLLSAKTQPSPDASLP